MFKTKHFVCFFLAPTHPFIPPEKVTLGVEQRDVIEGLDIPDNAMGFVFYSQTFCTTPEGEELSGETHDESERYVIGTLLTKIEISMLADMPEDEITQLQARMDENNVTRVVRLGHNKDDFMPLGEDDHPIIVPPRVKIEVQPTTLLVPDTVQ